MILLPRMDRLVPPAVILFLKPFATRAAGIRPLVFRQMVELMVLRLTAHRRRVLTVTALEQQLLKAQRRVDLLRVHLHLLGRGEQYVAGRTEAAALTVPPQDVRLQLAVGRMHLGADTQWAGVALEVGGVL